MRSLAKEYGGIYVLSFKEDPRYYKVGKTVGFRNRFFAYQTHVPYQINIDLMYPIDPYTEVQVESAEQVVHGLLECFLVKGEWFDKNAYSVSVVHTLQKDIGFKPFVFSGSLKKAEFTRVVEQTSEGEILC